VDYQKLSVLWDALNGTDTILLKIRKAIVVKISMVKGKLPVSSVVLGPEDLARYSAVIDRLSSDDEESSRPGRTDKCRIRGAVSPDGQAANPDSWDPNERIDASQFTTSKNLPPMLPAQARRRPSSSQLGQNNPESGSSPIVVHHQRRGEVSATPVRQKCSRMARMQVSDAPIPDSEAAINQRSQDGTRESRDGDLPSSERYDQKEWVPLESELGSELELESEGDSGHW